MSFHNHLFGQLLSTHPSRCHVRKSQTFGLCCIWKKWWILRPGDEHIPHPVVCFGDIETRAGHEGPTGACDCVQPGGRRPVKWDMAPSIWAADLCALADGTNESTAARSDGLMNLLVKLSPSLMNGPISKCITFLNYRSCANTSNTRVLQKVARRKES